MTKRKCLGYGEAEGRCTNEAGTPWTPYWCPSCDELRRATITAQLEALSETHRQCAEAAMADTVRCGERIDHLDGRIAVLEADLATATRRAEAAEGEARRLREATRRLTAALVIAYAVS